MAGESTTPVEVYGIETETSGITVETESITESLVVEPVPNQKNKVVNEIKNDTRYDLKLTYRGTKLAHVVSHTTPAGNDTVEYGGHVWSVDSHESAGSYNGLKRYNLSAHRFSEYPAQPTPAQQGS